jgi:hypothetical protein
MKRLIWKFLKTRLSNLGSFFADSAETQRGVPDSSPAFNRWLVEFQLQNRDVIRRRLKEQYRRA